MPAPIITYLQDFVRVFSNAPSIYANALYTRLFWRSKEVDKYKAQTGDTVSSLTAAQIIIIID